MNPTSKKNITVHSKNQSVHSKGLKRSKSTEHIIPAKLPKRVDRTICEAKSLSKSKSTKSLKGKTKSSDCSNKKPKGKKSQTKTVKKGLKKETNQLSSILSEDWEEIKKPVLQYFIYHNNYIPIENSAQRRLVYKIQMIDIQNNSTSETFFPRKEQVGIVTESNAYTDIGVGQQISMNSLGSQTEKFQQMPEKCFMDVLTDLQFLYLPNEDNFAPFSAQQRTHYSQLLETLAKKMLGQKRAVTTQTGLSSEQITVLLYQREGIQVGALEFIPLQGFPTHLLSILAYLKNLFCFLEYGFKEEVLNSLRQFYGLNYNQRIKRLSRRLPHERDNRHVLGIQIFQAFENEMFRDYNFSSKMVQECVHAHNRAIFDAVNYELQTFRPFFSSEGEPFPWTNNLGMTHYDITEQALYIVFVQVKQRIQKYAITLCGMMTDFDDETLPSPAESPLYKKKMDERELKMLQDEIKSLDDRVTLDYEASSLYFDLANEIFYQLVGQMEDELTEIKELKVQEVFQFQYFN